MGEEGKGGRKGEKERETGKQRKGLTRNLLLGEDTKKIQLPLIRRAAPMPEEEPLQALASFQFVREAKHFVPVGDIDEVEQFGGRFHDGEGGRLRVVDEDGDPAFIQHQAGSTAAEKKGT